MILVVRVMCSYAPVVYGSRCAVLGTRVLPMGFGMLAQPDQAFPNVNLCMPFSGCLGQQASQVK